MRYEHVDDVTLHTCTYIVLHRYSVHTYMGTMNSLYITLLFEACSGSPQTSTHEVLLTVHQVLVGLNCMSTQGCPYRGAPLNTDTHYY